MSTLGLNVWWQRKVRGISQTQLAAMVPIADSALRSIEAHGAEPNLRTLRRFREIYNCTYDELIADPAQMSLVQCKRWLEDVSKLEAEGDAPASAVARARAQLMDRLMTLEGGLSGGAPGLLGSMDRQLSLPQTPPRRAGGRRGR